MNMKKKIWFSVVFFFVLFITGCSHKAETMRDDGIWEERQMSLVQDNISSDQCKINLSIKVKQDMTEEEMLKVLDYYEKEIFTDMGAGEKVNIGGKQVEIEKRNIDMCYAIFYKGDTDEVLKEFKYANGKNVPVMEEDEAYFDSMKMDDQAEGDQPND